MKTGKKKPSLKQATDATLCSFFFNQSTNVRGVTMCRSSLSKIAPFDVFFSVTLLVYISCQFRVHAGCDHSEVWSTSLGSWPQTVKSQLDLQRQNSTLTAGGPVGACLHSSARALNASGWMLLVNIKICVQIALNILKKKICSWECNLPCDNPILDWAIRTDSLKVHFWSTFSTCCMSKLAHFLTFNS